MWIVKVAVERPYTFIVLALLISHSQSGSYSKQHSGCGRRVDLHRHESRRVGGTAYYGL